MRGYTERWVRRLSVLYRTVTVRRSAETWEYRYTFEQVEHTPLDRWDHALLYDPVNDRILMFGGVARLGFEEIWTPVDDVWAYDPATDKWTLLLTDNPTPNG